MKVLFDAIRSRFLATEQGAQTDLYNDLKGQLYFTQASQKATFPYCVYTPISHMYEFQFIENFENIVIQFSIFSLDASAENIEKYFEDLKVLYDWCNLTIDGYRHVYMRRGQSRLLRDDRAWHRITDYRCYIEKI